MEYNLEYELVTISATKSMSKYIDTELDVDFKPLRSVLQGHGCCSFLIDFWY